MNLVTNIIAALYLILCTLKDIKTYTISLPLSILTGLTLIILRLSIPDTTIYSILLSLIPGCVILLLAYMTHESIGYGDGIVLNVIGIALGLNSLIFLLLMALIFSSVFALFLILKRKSGKTTFPFVPFISCSYFTAWLFNIF